MILHARNQPGKANCVRSVSYSSSELPPGLSRSLPPPQGKVVNCLLLLLPSRCHRLPHASLRSVLFLVFRLATQLSIARCRDWCERPGINPEPPVTSRLSRVFSLPRFTAVLVLGSAPFALLDSYGFEPDAFGLRDRSFSFRGRRFSAWLK